MYSRFLKESATITKNNKLIQMAEKINQSGVMFSKIGHLFKDAETAKDITDRINYASDIFSTIAELEEETCKELLENVE
jgi:hypothetical protein